MKKAKDPRKSSTQEQTGSRMPVLTPAQFKQKACTALVRAAPLIFNSTLMDTKEKLDMNFPLGLKDAFDEYMRHPNKEADAIAAFVSQYLALMGIGLGPPIARSRILPLLRNRSWL